MAISAAMSSSQEHDHEDHEHDMVMPGFRFHPTEEELVEFYLRRKVEGKRFNVELITFLDLYRYDPWELPALAAIGEKEWFFYVPRDRKYRNGDRPNRVTTSGYWKATGADRMIRTETFRAIGLKKTLVFYSGKAPKGIRTSWIMNEYRLPHHETERLQKAEISLCRVYKRPGVEDHLALPRSLPTRASSSTRGPQPEKKHTAAAAATNHCPTAATAAVESFQTYENVSETSGSSTSNNDIVGLSNQNFYIPLAPILDHEQDRVALLHHHQPTTIFMGSSLLHHQPSVDDLHRLVNYQPQAVATLHAPPLGLPPQIPFSDRMWDWSSTSEGSKDYISPFK